jgi:hypothetical protein
MREMRALAMGQYGHNNQPSHHVLWLLGLLGYRSDQDKLIREVIDRAYGVDFYAGDEDNGEMGAWFVLAALGLFSVSPASPDYVIGMPLFDKVSLHVPGRPVLEISAVRKDRSDLDVVETSLDDVKLSETISFSQLVKGGSLITKTRDASEGGDPRGNQISVAPRHRRDVGNLTHTLMSTGGESLAKSRDSFWGSLTRKDNARQSDHAESANFSPTEVPVHHDIEERGPHHIVATPAPIRDHPMLRAHRDAVQPSSSFPVWAIVGVLAAFLLGRGSKRKRATGKRGSRVV